MINIIGGGLAGCEAAWQLARRGVPVTLHEQKPHRRTPAQTSDHLAELVCSNSFRSSSPMNAVGLIKEEMAALGSMILWAATQARVPAGDALAVDRERFAALVTETIRGEFTISQPGVSQHLKVLRDNGFTSVRAEGQRRLYAVDPSALQDVDEWLNRFRRFWAPRLDALDTEVARGKRQRRIDEHTNDQGRQD